MYPLIETIKVSGRKFHNLRYHQSRVDRSLKQLFGNIEIFELDKVLIIPDYLQNGLYKCRVVYGATVGKVELLPYSIKPIQSLKVVVSDQIDYALKYSDRKLLNELYNQRGNCDDILIVKNMLITDTSYCNILFDNGSGWFTPASPLLRGTQREKLINEGLVKTAEISLENLKDFKRFMLINAMMEFDENRATDISEIKF